VIAVPLSFSLAAKITSYKDLFFKGYRLYPNKTLQAEKIPE
jgi:hypothetical protein